MLVLSRYEGEEIVLTVGDVQIVVGVQKVKNSLEGRKVRLGITAPPEVVINRREVHEAIERERVEGDAI